MTRRAAAAGFAWVAAASTLRPAIAAAQPKRFGVGLPDLRRRYYERMLQGIRDAANNLEAELQVVEYGYDPVMEVAETRRLFGLGLDGYVIAPLRPNDEALAATLSYTRAPVAAVDRPIQGASVTVVPDLAAAGAIQARVAMSVSSQNSTVLYLGGVPGLIEPAAAQGFAKAIDRNRFAIVEVSFEGFSLDEAAARTAEALASHPNVTVVAAATDVWAQGAVIAAGRLGRTIKVIGLGASAEGLGAVAKHEFVATVDLEPGVQGSAALRGVARVVQTGICDNGQNPPCPEQSVAPTVVLADKDVK